MGDMGTVTFYTISLVAKCVWSKCDIFGVAYKYSVEVNGSGGIFMQMSVP